LDEAKDKTKKDLAAFIGKMAKKEMNSFQKKGSPKRKKEDDNNNSVKLANTFDLSAMDYEDMSNLSIQEKGEVSSKEQLRRDDKEFIVSSPESSGEKDVIDNLD
jgi:hypothetical protein